MSQKVTKRITNILEAVIIPTDSLYRFHRTRQALDMCTIFATILRAESVEMILWLIICREAKKRGEGPNQQIQIMQPVHLGDRLLDSVRLS